MHRTGTARVEHQQSTCLRSHDLLFVCKSVCSLLLPRKKGFIISIKRSNNNTLQDHAYVVYRINITLSPPNLQANRKSKFNIKIPCTRTWRRRRGEAKHGLCGFKSPEKKKKKKLGEIGTQCGNMEIFTMNRDVDSKKTIWVKSWEILKFMEHILGKSMSLQQGQPRWRRFL